MLSPDDPAEYDNQYQQDCLDEAFSDWEYLDDNDSYGCHQYDNYYPYDDDDWFHDDYYESNDPQPGNHVSDAQGDLYVVTDRYTFVNLTTGQTKSFLKDLKVVWK